MLPNVVSVTQTGPYRLKLRFDDGAVRGQRKDSGSEPSVVGTKTDAEQGAGTESCGFRTRENGLEAVMEQQEAAPDRG